MGAVWCRSSINVIYLPVLTLPVLLLFLPYLAPPKCQEQRIATLIIHGAHDKMLTIN